MAGLLSTFLGLEQRERDKRAAKASGLLGASPQEAVIGELDRFSFPLQAAQAGTGYRGSDRGIDAQTDLTQGLLQAGYNPQQVQSLLASETVQQKQQQAISNLAIKNQLEAQKPTTLMKNLQAANVDLSSIEGQKTMLNAIMKPTVQIGGSAGAMWTPQQVEQAGLPKDSVVTTDKYGKPQILNKEKYTQAQHVSGGFAMRMDTAGQEINSIMSEFPDFDPTGLRQHADIALPEWMANVARSPEGQRYEQAKENWISANLRKESGAVLGEEEIVREKAKWFPAYGDSPSVIAQKKRARRDAENSLQKSAGGAYQDLIDKAESDRLSELRGKHGAQ